MLERAVCSWSLPASSDPVEDGLPDRLHVRVWALRKAAVGVCAATAFYFAYAFVDYNKVCEGNIYYVLTDN